MRKIEARCKCKQRVLNLVACRGAAMNTKNKRKKKKAAAQIGRLNGNANLSPIYIFSVLAVFFSLLHVDAELALLTTLPLSCSRLSRPIVMYEHRERGRFDSIDRQDLPTTSQQQWSLH